MRELKIPNFKRGMRVDNIDEDDQILSLRNMVNADIDFRTGAAVRRNGYSYFIQTLSAQAKQIFEFYDTVGRSNLLLIMDEKLYWYRSTDTTLYEVKNASVSPTTSLDFATYDHYPFLTVGDRCFFADDNGFWWVDNTSLVWEYPPTTPLPLCYQVGIDVPDFELGGDSEVSLSYTDTTNDDFVDDLGATTINDTVRLKLAQSFVAPRDMRVDAARIYFWLVSTDPPSTSAGFIVSLYDDNGGNPGTQVTNAISYRSLDDMYNVSPLATFVRLDFTKLASLTSGSTYWIVVEGDTAYYNWYSAGVNVAGVGRNTSGYAGIYKSYNGTIWSTIAGQDMLFVIGGGLVEEGEYKYTCTYKNTAYKSESAPLDFHIKETDLLRQPLTIIPDDQAILFQNLDMVTDDAQVDKVRLYRTKDGEDTYYLVDEIDPDATYFWDMVDDDNLGAELQTTDHTRLTDRDDNLIVPRHLEWWQHRIWAVPAISDTFYYSKRLEEAGATGVAGDPAYDYFPQEASYRNDWDVKSTIVAMKVHEGRLIVYTDRHDVHIFSGANQPLNPPPDLSHERLIIGEGILNYRGLVDLRGKHVFVTQDHEIKGFIGSIDMEDISDVMDSVLAGLTTIHAFVWNNQYMLLGNSNADGVMDTIYILDLSRRVLSPWRKYQYADSVGTLQLYDVCLTNAGILYAIAKNGNGVYSVVQLDSGTSDGWTTLENDGTAITKTLQTHDIRPAKRAFWQEVGIRGYYPTSTIPTYVTTCTDLTGETTTSAFDPTSSEDMLGHAHGLRMASHELSLNIKSTGAEKDEIRELFVRYRL